ncbi:MAG: cytochrome P460 family protein [Pseudobdellovibrio sp.]
MKKLTGLGLLIALMLGSLSPAQENAEIKTFKKDEMNGYKLSDFPDFEKKWKLVTVRFRKDTGEMRFTYANDQALETLLKGATDYPDGAVFAKIGIKTSEDPAFPSSAVPAGARRYQFMVRDKKKFASTEGWGYVLFDKGGTIYPEDVGTQTAACAACHRIIPERGYVFSQMMELAVFKDNQPVKAGKKEIPFSEKIKFKEINVAQLPEELKTEIPKSYKKAQQVDHEISQFLFQGTLDEIKPLLSEQAVKTKQPALILSADKKTYALVYIENLEIQCEQEGKKGFFMKAVSTSPQTGTATSTQQKNINYENRYCWTP